MSKRANIVIWMIVILIIAGVGIYFKVLKPETEMPMTENAAPVTASAPIVVSGDTVTLNEQARQLAGIQTARAATRNLRKEIRTTGKIVINERARTYLSSRVEGRLERLYTAVEGEYIYPGQILGEVYSPAYIAAQEEYLQLLNGNGNGLRDAARRRLSILNVDVFPFYRRIKPFKTAFHTGTRKPTYSALKRRNRRGNICRSTPNSAVSCWNGRCSPGNCQISPS